MDTESTDLSARLFGHLDTLVAFLALAHDEVFDVVRSEYESWVPSEQQSTLPDNAEIYRTQVSHAAFLLGFSYFEAFLSDTIRLLFHRRPAMLPRDKKVSFAEVLDLDEDRSPVDVLIEKEVRDVMFGSMGSVRDYFGRRLNIAWPEFPRLAEASALRNCIVHNWVEISQDRVLHQAILWFGRWTGYMVQELGATELVLVELLKDVRVEVEG